MRIFKCRKTRNVWRKTSYSQSGEDILVKCIFDDIGIKNPSYLDIGAHHPYRLNNTALFYELGSRGVNIEPDPALFKEFIKERPHDINLNLGIGMESGVIDLYIMDSKTLNTFSKEEAERIARETQFKIIETIKVPVETYPRIIEKHFGNKPPDFLSLDVEGLDESIIKGINFDKHAPVVICIETLSFVENGRGVKNKPIIQFLESNGYMIYADTNINSIFVQVSRWKK